MPRSPRTSPKHHSSKSYQHEKAAAEPAKVVSIALGLGRPQGAPCGARAMLTAGAAKAKLGLIRERQKLCLGK